MRLVRCPTCQELRPKLFCLCPASGFAQCEACWFFFARSEEGTSTETDGKVKCPETGKGFPAEKLKPFRELSPEKVQSMIRRPVASHHSEQVRKTAECLFHDSRNVAVSPLPEWLRSAEILRKWEFFGQYGQILDILIPNIVEDPDQQPEIRSRRAVIRYETPDAARLAVRCASGALVSVNDRKHIMKELAIAQERSQAGMEDVAVPVIDVVALQLSLHPTRYSSYFLKGEACPKEACVELHEEVFTAHGPSEAGSNDKPQEAPPKIISTEGASNLPMVNFLGSVTYIRNAISGDLRELLDNGRVKVESPTVAGEPTSSGGGPGMERVTSSEGGIMELINPNKAQKLSAGARPFIPGVGGGGAVGVGPTPSSVEPRVSTWQGVLTEEMAFMASIQSLRKDHSKPGWENRLFEPVVFPYTRGLALPSPAQKDGSDEKLLSEHRLYKVVDI